MAIFRVRTKKFQLAANRTILTLKALAIAHPKFFKTHLKIVDTFKILGPSPLQSEVIQICVRQNEKIISLNHFDNMNPPKLFISPFKKLGKKFILFIL